MSESNIVRSTEVKLRYAAASTPFIITIASSRSSRRPSSSFPLVSFLIITDRFSLLAFRNSLADSEIKGFVNLSWAFSTPTRERSVGKIPPSDDSMRKRYVLGGGSSKSFRSAFCASWYARLAAMMTTLYSPTKGAPAAMSVTCRASSTEKSP